MDNEVRIARDTPLAEIEKLTHPCACQACNHGCTMGSGVLADGDAERIAAHLGISVEELKAKHLEEIEKFNTKRFRPKLLRENRKPYGQCTFFREGKGCAIHPVKPVECRIAMPCKSYGDKLITWFDVNHFLNPDDPESVRQYAAYLTVDGILLPNAELEAIVPDPAQRGKIFSYEVLK